MGSSPVRPREAPPFKVRKEARPRVNLEQATAFRPGNREVHFGRENYLFHPSCSFPNEVLIKLTRGSMAIPLHLKQVVSAEKLLMSPVGRWETLTRLVVE
jgi:hypothetical protein